MPDPVDLQNGAVLHIEPVSANRPAGPYFRVTAYVDGERCYRATTAMPGLGQATLAAMTQVGRILGSKFQGATSPAGLLGYLGQILS